MSVDYYHDTIGSTELGRTWDALLLGSNDSEPRRTYLMFYAHNQHNFPDSLGIFDHEWRTVSTLGEFHVRIAFLAFGFENGGLRSVHYRLAVVLFLLLTTKNIRETFFLFMFFAEVFLSSMCLAALFLHVTASILTSGR